MCSRRRVNAVVDDGVVPIWHHAICNYHDYGLGLPLRLRVCQRNAFAAISEMCLTTVLCVNDILQIA